MRHKKETALQIAICEYIRAIAPNLHWHSIPNEIAGGGKGAAIRTSLAVKMGLKKGAADLLIIHRGQAIYIEVKTDKGRQSKDQKEFEESAKMEGAYYYVVKDISDIDEIFRIHKIPTRSSSKKN